MKKQSFFASMRNVAITCVFFDLVSASVAQTVLLNDTFSTNSLSNYTHQNGTPTHSSTAGVGGGGGLTADFAVVASAYNTGLSLTTNQSYTTSIFLRYNGNNGSTSTVGSVGFGESTTVNAAGNQPPYLSVAITNPTAGNWQLNYRYAYNTILTSQTAGTALPVTSGNWYVLSATITKISTTNTWSISGELQDWGADGLAYTNTRTSFGSVGIEMTGDTSFYSASSYHPFFAGRSFNGVGSIDNFSVSAIPEPSTYAAMAGAAAMIGAWWVRRRQSADRRSDL